VREVAVTEASLPLARQTRFDAARAVDWLFCGQVRGFVYPLLRIGIAVIFLVRHSDWLRPWVFLEHYRFVRGLMFLEATPAEPRLISPLIAGFSLGDGATRGLVLARTVLSVTLLLGVRAQLSAALLALVSYTLLLADRYRYYHHLHLLYVSLAFLALAPIGRSFNVEHTLGRWVTKLRGGTPRPVSLPSLEPRWALQLLRALVIGVYAAAGASKMTEAWLAGDVLLQLERFGVLHGSVWEAVRATVGYGAVAKASLAAELLLPVGLMLRRTRVLAVAGGVAFHAGISASMPVYSFGAQMAVLLVTFLPWLDPPPGDSSTEPAPPDTRRA
jgi:hypothetical protein